MYTHYVCLCAVQHAESCGWMVCASQPPPQIHPCMLIQEDKESVCVCVFIFICVHLCTFCCLMVFMYSTVSVFVCVKSALESCSLHVCVCGVRACSATDLLCCIAACPAHPEVAVVLHQGTLPRSQQVNPPHLHTQPMQGSINTTPNLSAVRAARHQ